MPKIIDNRKLQNCVFGDIDRGEFYINSRGDLCIKTGSDEEFDIQQSHFRCVHNKEIVTHVEVEISIVD